MPLFDRYKLFVSLKPADRSVAIDVIRRVYEEAGKTPSNGELKHVLWLTGGWAALGGLEPDKAIDTVEDLYRYVRTGDSGNPGPGPVPPMTYGDHRGNFLYPFFGPAQLGQGRDRFGEYVDTLVARGDTDILINAEQDPWMIREGHPEWGAGFDVYRNEEDLADLLWALPYCRARGLRPHVGLIDQPTLRELYDYNTEGGWSRTKGGTDIREMTEWLMEQIKGQATLIMPSWELGEVMSDGSHKSHEVMEARLVEWATWIYEIDPEVWVGIHHADGLRGGNNFYSMMREAIGHRACRYAQWSTDDRLNALEQKTSLAIQVADRTGTSLCIMEHSSPVRVGPGYSEEDAIDRARACQDAGLVGERQANFMNGYPKKVKKADQP